MINYVHSLMRSYFFTKMPNYCVVKGCKNSADKRTLSRSQPLSNKTDAKISFHVFPKDSIRRQKWVKALQLESVKEHDHICSDHFSEDAVDRTSLNIVRLRDHAVPNINLKEFSSTKSLQIPVVNLTESEKDDSAEEEEAINSSANRNQVLNSSTLCNSKNQNSFHWNVSFEFANGSTPKISIPVNFQRPSMIQSFENKSVDVQKSETYVTEKLYVDRATSVSPERLFNSPTKQAIRDYYQKELKEQKKKFKTLSAKLRRTEKNVTILSDALKELKSLSSRKK